MIADGEEIKATETDRPGGPGALQCVKLAMRKATILIIAPSADVHAFAVAKQLRVVHGADVATIDTSEFPQHYSAGFGAGATHLTRTIGDVDLSVVRSVWWRRPLPCAVPASSFGLEKDFAQWECEHLIQGLLWQLPCLWVNDPQRNAYASRKLVQLEYARRAGLRIPRTLATNDPGAALQFVRSASHRVIAKRIATVPGPFTKTSFVNDDILESLPDALPGCPAIFQEYIEGRGDVRVTWIDDLPWSIIVDSHKGRVPEDSRLDMDVPHAIYRLDAATESQLRSFMRDLGLRFGAIDLRLGTDGNLYFLEVNPAGQFAFAEVMTSLPVVAAMAALLATGTAAPGNT